MAEPKQKTTKKSPSSKAKAPSENVKNAKTKAAAAAEPAKVTAGAKKVKPAGQAVGAGPAAEAKNTVAATKSSGSGTSRPSGASGVFQIKLVRSLIGSSPHQRAVIAGLGLRRLNQIVTRKDTREIRGMVAKVPHLVDILA